MGLLSLLLLVGLVLLAKQTLVFHTALVPAPGGEISYGLVGQPTIFNPVLAATNTDQTMSRLIFSGLYTYSTKGELIPELAAALPTVSEDGKTYTVELAPNQLWHDGVPVTSDDVLFTIKKIQNPSLNSPLNNLWSYTKVRSTDINTLIFELPEANAAFVHNLTFGLLPAHTWKDITDESFASSPLNFKPLGSGAFSVRQIKRDKTGTVTEVQLEKFGRYHKPAWLQSVRVKFYRSTEELAEETLRGATQAGLLESNMLSGEGTSSNRFRGMAYTASYQAIYFNTSNGPTAEKSVRQALASQINWQSVVDAWKSGIRPLSTPPIGLATTPFEGYYFAGEPKKLLAPSSTATRNRNTTLTLAAPNYTPYPDIANKIKQDWEKLGLLVDLVILDPEKLAEEIIRPRNFSALIFSQTTNPDPDSFPYWHSSQVFDPGVNITQFANFEADQLLTRGRASTDKATREQIYKKLQELLNQELPAIFYGQNGKALIADTQIQGPADSYLPDPTWQLIQLNIWYTNTERTYRQ